MTNQESNASGQVHDQDKSLEERQTQQAHAEYDAKIQGKMKDIVDKVGQNITEKQMMPKDAVGFDDATIEGIYGYGYRLYNAQKYGEAFTLFRTLMLLNPVEKKYLFGMAACLHRLHEYADAIKVYLLSSVFDPDNPVIFFHVADCYAHLNALSFAEGALENVIKLSQDKAAFRVLHERARLMLESIRNGTFTLPKEPQETRKWGHGDDDVDADEED